MTRLRWFLSARTEEQGDFCDVKSQNTYDNMTPGEARAVKADAERSGHDVADMTDIHQNSDLLPGEGERLIKSPTRVNHLDQKTDRLGHGY